MCDASDFAVGAVLGQRIDGKFKPIYYASKTLNNAQEHYTTTEKELLIVVFSFDKFRPYLIKDKRGDENLVSDHLSRLENPDLETFTEEEIADEFSDEHLMVLKTELNNDEPWVIIVRRRREGKFTNLDSSGLLSLKMQKDYVMRCDACQRLGNISSRSEMPQNNIQVEAHALPTNDARVVIKFLRRLFARFGVPKAFIKIEHKAYWALKQCNMDLTVAVKNRFMELNELMELRDGAYENTRIYKERTKKWHDSRLRGDKDFKDLVKEISTNIGEEFTNLEILKCWSLETSRRLFNTILIIKSTWRIYRANTRGVSHSNSI
ncbi:DNA-directed DNA polymerase [Tanacetum coccineum]